MCGSGVRWCARADAMFDVPGMHVLDVRVDEQQRLVVTIESDQIEHGCPRCGVIAVGHGRRCRVLHDAPCWGRVTVVRWLRQNLAVPGAGLCHDDLHRTAFDRAASGGADDTSGPVGHRCTQP